MSANREPDTGTSTGSAPSGGIREPDKAPHKIAGMFDAIAGRYDLLNTVLSGGLDRYWRRRAIASLQLTGRERLLDVCAGTADVAIGAARRTNGAARVVGVDFSSSMLAHGRVKVKSSGLSDRIQLIQGDAMALPVAADSVNAATIAFGIRNVQRPEIACKELLRVLRPGGRIAILEFGTPHNPVFAPIYRWYSSNILPRIGRAVSRHEGAYTYLPESIGAFAYGSEFCRILRDAGFSQVHARPFMFGAVYLYTGSKGAKGSKEFQ